MKKCRKVMERWRGSLETAGFLFVRGLELFAQVGALA